MSCVKHSGKTLSSTVTTALHVEALALKSVTVKTTLFVPTSAQVNASISIA